MPGNLKPSEDSSKSGRRRRRCWTTAGSVDVSAHGEVDEDEDVEFDQDGEREEDGVKDEAS